METSRAEELLKGHTIQHEQSAVVAVKKIDNNIRQIQLENGKKIHVSKDRVKAIVSTVLMAQARAKAKPAASPGMQFASMYQNRGRK